jgi:hypothetical protein
MSIQKELKGITPILQSELIKQIGKVMDALDDNNLDRAFRCLKTLIQVSPPKVKTKVVPDLDRIEKEIEKAKRIKGVDLYQARQLRKRRTIAILQMETRPLFDKVMHWLYEGGYLEIYRRPVETNVPDEVFLAQR